MYKYLLQSVENIDYLALAPLLLFFFFFIGISTWALKTNNSYIQKMENLPFEDDHIDQHNN